MPAPSSDPVQFPDKDPDTGRLTWVDHWSLEQVAEMFGVSLATARRRVKEGEWTVWEPLPGVPYMTADHIAEARERRMRRARPPDPEVPDLPDLPTRLGIPVADADLEGIR